MGKYLLLIAGVVVLYWVVRIGLRRKRKVTRDDKSAAEDMVRCAQCGIHLPRGESLVVRGHYYCCADHQQRHNPGD
jgi:uncharacterized protein